MPNRKFLCVLSAAFAFAAAARAAEVTYGDTRAVPKERPASSDNGSSGTTESGSDDGDGDGPDWLNVHIGDRDTDRDATFMTRKPDAGKGLAGACFSYEIHPNTLGEAAASFIFVPFWWGLCSAGYEVVMSHVHLAFGNDEAENPARDPWRMAAGFGVDAGWLPRTASGPGTGVHLETVGPLAKAGAGTLDLRLRAEAAVTAQSMKVDYERFVFSGNRFLGTERDSISGYTQWAFPLSAEVLWHPGTRGFYLGAGGGAVWLQETVDFTRSTPVGYGAGPHLESMESWHPAAALALGRDGLDRRGRPSWYFEIRYQALLQNPMRRSSFPSDNASATHSLGWVWGWYW